jgi:hypothetical protein
MPASCFNVISTQCGDLAKFVFSSEGAATLTSIATLAGLYAAAKRLIRSLIAIAVLAFSTIWVAGAVKNGALSYVYRLYEPCYVSLPELALDSPKRYLSERIYMDIPGGDEIRDGRDMIRDPDRPCRQPKPRCNFACFGPAGTPCEWRWQCTPYPPIC